MLIVDLLGECYTVEFDEWWEHERTAITLGCSPAGTCLYERKLQGPPFNTYTEMKTAIFTKLFADRSLEKSFELATELGYDAVELMCRAPHLGANTTDERARSLRNRLDELDLEVAGMATYTGHYLGKSKQECERELEELERFVQLSDILGTDLLRHGVGGPPDHEAEQEDFEEAETWLRRACDLAADYDKQLGVEIHAGVIPETATATVDLLEQVDRDNVGVIHDAGNMYIVGTNYGAESIETLGDLLCHVHVKDELRVDDLSLPGAFELETKQGNEVFQHRLLGHGGADHGELFESLIETGYDGYLSAECHRATSGPWTDVAIAGHELEMMNRLVEQARSE